MTATRPPPRGTKPAPAAGSVGATRAKAPAQSFEDSLAPLIAAGHGVHVKNLYNLYVYFWRWALWKVFERETANGPGIVSFITASSYIDGDAFCGMREHLRRLCNEVWILDLGGEGRGTRKSEMTFAIQTPVAIAVVVRSKRRTRRGPARSITPTLRGRAVPSSPLSTPSVISRKSVGRIAPTTGRPPSVRRARVTTSPGRS